jgi:hypothetical protein
MKITIPFLSWTGKQTIEIDIANLSGVDLRGANLSGVNLRGANLSGVDLRGVDLEGAYLRGVNLREAGLEGVKNYSNSHDICAEIVRRNLEEFTVSQKAICLEIYLERICWDEIKKRYGKEMLPIFKKLAEAGFGEWLEKYKSMKEE